MLLSCSRLVLPTSCGDGRSQICFCCNDISFQYPWTMKTERKHPHSYLATNYSSINEQSSDASIPTHVKISARHLLIVPNIEKTKGKKRLNFCSTAASPRAWVLPRSKNRGRRSNRSPESTQLPTF